MKRTRNLIVTFAAFILLAPTLAHAVDTTVTLCSAAGSADAGRTIESRIAGVANLVADVNGCVTFDVTTDSSGKGLLALYGQGFLLQSVAINPTLGVAATSSGKLTINNITGAGNYSLQSAATTTTYTETAKAIVPAQGDILDYSNGAGQRSSLVDVAVGSVVISGGVGAVPTYGTVPAAALATQSSVANFYRSIHSGSTNAVVSNSVASYFPRSEEH